MNGNNSIGKWIKNFEHRLYYNSKTLPQNFTYEIIDFRGFTKFIDNKQLLIYGIYNFIICYKRPGEEGSYQTHYFPVPFSEIISIKSLNLANTKESEKFNIVVSKPTITDVYITKSNSINTLKDFLTIFSNKTVITIKGELCCEIFSKTKVKRTQESDNSNAIDTEISNVNIKTKRQEKEQDVTEQKQKSDFLTTVQSYKEENRDEKSKIKNEDEKIRQLLAEYYERKKSGNNELTKIDVRQRTNIPDKKHLYNLKDNPLNLSEDEYNRLKQRIKEAAGNG